MSDDTLAPGFVRFIQHRLPSLDAGAYRLTIKQMFKIDGVDIPPQVAGDFTAVRHFSVSGERFQIDPTEIDSTYPLMGAQGEFSKVLPHLVLSRATLPWLRSPESDFTGTALQPNADVAAWLALLMFDEDDAPPDLQALTVGDLAVPPAGIASYPILQTIPVRDANGTVMTASVVKPEVGFDKAAPCAAIDVEWSLFSRIAPSLEDLKWLATVRVVSGRRPGKPDIEAAPDEYAVLMANRLPKLGTKTTVHLVSLEGMEPYLPKSLKLATTLPRKVRLVSLYRWSFDTHGDPETFGTAVEALHSGPFSLTTPAAPPPTDAVAYKVLKRALELGYVPLPHALRAGGQTASWYRGPLSPTPVSRTLLSGGTLTSADSAMIFDPATGLLDVSYAAAWQLGRMTALADKGFAQDFYIWRHGHSAALAHALEAAYLHAALAPTPSKALQAVPCGGLHLQAAALLRAAASAAQGVKPMVPSAKPSPSAPPVDPDAQTLPNSVIAWFDALRRLQGVPFGYLVPHSDLLPSESIRFFHLDMNWLDALIDGAFSLGAATAGDIAKPAALHSSTAAAAGVDAVGVTGFLVRSHVIKHWPGLQAASFDSSGQLLSIVRYERVADDVLLCLIDGVATRIELHQPPEALHYGVDIVDAGMAAPDPHRKILRDPITGAKRHNAPSIAPLPWREAGARILDVAALASAAAVACSAHSFTSAEFALTMIEGVDLVTFNVFSQTPSAS